MKEVFVSTQAEFDALPKQFEEYTKIVIKNTAVRIVLTARENSSVEARENSSVVAWGNSSVEAWENSSVVARGNSSVVAWGNSVVRIFSAYVEKIALYGFAVAIISATITVKIEKKSEYCHIQVTKDLGWFERNAVEQTPTVTLYKRVSKDFKTQESTANETTWTIGTTLTVPNWNTDNECGPGRFHACSRPYFCDEFRSNKGDRYIAVEIKLEDLHEWKNDPQYPHKIAFRSGTVLYECDKWGKEITK